eukprot:scaffold106577_cov45-Prasinocladus_malaysianus.AAC.1
MSQGWLLGYDALAFMVQRAANPTVPRPRVNEDAMVGVLLETCSQCTRQYWKKCEAHSSSPYLDVVLQVLGGTAGPFATLREDPPCPSLFQRLGMAVSDDELGKLKCLITASELKKPKYMQGMHQMVTKGFIPSRE